MPGNEWFELDMAPWTDDRAWERDVYRVTAVDRDAGVITVNRADAARRYTEAANSISSARVESERYWEQVDRAQAAIARLQDLQVTPRIWVDGSGPAPRESDTDAIEMRLRSYASVTVNNPWLGIYDSLPPIEMVQTGYATWETNESVQWRSEWATLWQNLGLAHTAGVFMLEIHWNGKEFTNAEAIRSRLSY